MLPAMFNLAQETLSSMRMPCNAKEEYAIMVLLY